jgi:benzil reductase ((S)-benzoin forming)
MADLNVAIITGTSRGLGAALLAQFVAIGWQVVSLNRPAFDLSSIDLSSLERQFSRIAGSGRVVLVNNAASHHIGPSAELLPETIDGEIRTNIIGPITLMSAFLRAFPQGEVVNITSSAATVPHAQWSLYSSAKAAMNTFIEHLRSEGVKCITLNPGAVDTDMQVAISNSSSPLPPDVHLRPANVVAKALVWQIDRG